MSVEKHQSNGRLVVNQQAHSGARGRPFPKGNGGRKPGSKNKATLVAEALLKGEEEELVRKAIQVAKAGDVQMLKFLLDRLLPKDRSVRIDLPEMLRADDAIDALGALINSVAVGQITPSEAAALGALVLVYAKAINVHELEARLDEHERKLQALEF
jgi:hypothetical protein